MMCWAGLPMLKRMIPVLLVDNKRLVKTRTFKEPKYVGDPLNAVKIFSEKEADELICLDIGASKRGQGPDFALIQDIASEARMPFAYGGGVRTLHQIEKLLKGGVEKIVLTHALFADFVFVKDALREFGSSTICACVNVKKNLLGAYKVYDYVAQKTRPESLSVLLKSLSDIGVGECILQSVERDGAMQGYDLKLLQKARPFVAMPLVMLGGGASLDHMKEAIAHDADAVAAGSFFVFYGKYRAVLITYPSYDERKEYDA